MSSHDKGSPPEPHAELVQPAADGAAPGLSISDTGGRVLHVAAPPVVSELRYAIAKLQLQKGGVPAKLGVTSAVSGEGVSFICRSLAAVLAHDLERRVCFVDLNWWSRSPSGANRPGIADVLKGAVQLEDVVQATDNSRLSLIPGGTVTPNERSQLARSLALQQVLDDLTVRYDHVLVDLPALLVASEAITIAGHIDTCLMVVQQGVTPAGMVRTALEHLRGVQVLGVVMNRAATPVPGPLLRRLLFS